MFSHVATIRYAMVPATAHLEEIGRECCDATFMIVAVAAIFFLRKCLELLQCKTLPARCKRPGGSPARRSKWRNQKRPQGKARELSLSSREPPGNLPSKALILLGARLTRPWQQRKKQPGPLEKLIRHSPETRVDFHRQWIAMVRENTNATLDFLHRVLDVKSPPEFIELSAEHARKRFETFAEQARQLTAMAQKMTADLAAPMRVGMKNALDEAA